MSKSSMRGRYMFKKSKLTSSLLIVLLASFCLVACVGAGSSSSGETGQSPNASSASTKMNQEEQMAKEAAGIKKLQQEYAYKERPVYGPGTYTTGESDEGQTTIPPGTYYFTADGRADVDIYLLERHGNPAKTAYGQLPQYGTGAFNRSMYVTFTKEQNKIKVSRASFTLADGIEHHLQDAVSTGSYLVGLDIPAGKYEVEQEPKGHTGMCYRVRNSADLSVKPEDVGTQPGTITVKVGQFLFLEDCVATLVE